jgi:ceramide glucosyltransferase
MALAGIAVLHDSRVLRLLWLVPLRDVVALGVWAGAYASHTVVWRGDVFSLKNGKLVRFESAHNQPRKGAELE